MKKLLFLLVFAMLSTAVFAANGLPTPPPTAIVFNNIENRGNWAWCNTPACAGGSGAGAYWMAQNQTSPSMSGSSMELYNSGVWANALFYQRLGPNDAVRNFLWDFYFYLDGNSVGAANGFIRPHPVRSSPPTPGTTSSGTCRHCQAPINTPM